MRFWLIELPSLILTTLWRVYLIVVSAVVTLCIVTVLIQVTALILGLPIPFVGSAPSRALAP